MEKKYKVQTTCYTYNHESYIKDAMDGFVMQKTTFPVVHVIVDDASTDGTVGVIDQYVHENFDFWEGSEAYEKETDFGHVIYARHKTNRNCYFAVICLRENHRSQKKPKRPYLREWAKESKYIAMCEGDDYWIDLYKLQKQVDFMESHQDYSMVCHNAIVKKGDKKSLFVNVQKDSHAIELEELLDRWCIPTASLLYRNEENLYPDDFPGFPNGDYALELLLFKRGRLYYMMSPMSIYRRHLDSLSVKMDNNKIGLYEGIISLLHYMKEGCSEKEKQSFDKAINRYLKDINDEKRAQKYPFLKYFNWRYYKRLLLKKTGLVKENK